MKKFFFRMLISTFAIYLFGALAGLSFSILAWSEEVRVIVGVFFLIAFIICSVVTYTDKD